MPVSKRPRRSRTIRPAARPAAYPPVAAGKAEALSELLAELMLLTAMLTRKISGRSRMRKDVPPEAALLLARATRMLEALAARHAARETACRIITPASWPARAAAEAGPVAWLRAAAARLRAAWRRIFKPGAAGSHLAPALSAARGGGGVRAAGPPKRRRSG